MARRHIEAAFAPGGPISRLMDGYLPRSSQLQLAKAADAAVFDGKILLAEAPAGVGKSFGYGVPIALSVGKQVGPPGSSWEGETRQVRALIVTSNIALQEQLAGRDLPLLSEAFGGRFSHALLKGRNNYLCLSKLARLEDGDLLSYGGGFNVVEALRLWATEQAAVGGSGDKAELPQELSDDRLWRQVSCGEGECKGMDCKHSPSCFAMRAKAEAFDADVVVCNYHLLFGAMKVGEDSKQGGVSEHVLPPFELIVMDEVHRAADTARSFFGFRITVASFDRAVALLGKLGDKAVADGVKIEGARLLDKLAKYAAGDKYDVRLKRPREFDGAGARAALTEAAGEYAKLALKEDDPDLKADLRLAQSRCKRIAARVAAAEELSDGGSVYFVDVEHGKPALAAKLVDVAPKLRAGLWENVRSAVCCSATLRVSGKFDHALAELGIPEKRRRVVWAPTPFDFSRQAMLVVPDGMPEPTSPRFAEAVGRELRRTVEVARGRTLALFTSRRVMLEARRALDGCGYEVLTQGDAPRTRLLERFRDEVSSVLLGLASFWEGVDVPGESLTCLVIDRLPFPRPDDPVLDAMNERLGRKCFFEYSIPRAVTTFCQGFGRLIRSVDDRGVVVVLDCRLLDKPYGRTFLNSLPKGTRFARGVEAAGELLDPPRPDPEGIRRAIRALEGLEV